jgi:hypothetical protein
MKNQSRCPSTGIAQRGDVDIGVDARRSTESRADAGVKTGTDWTYRAERIAARRGRDDRQSKRSHTVRNPESAPRSILPERRFL